MVKKKYPNFVPTYRKSLKGSKIVQHYDFSINEKNQVVVVPTLKEDIQAAINSHRDEVGLINVIKMATAKGVDPMSAPFANSSKDNLPVLPDFDTWDDVEKGRQEALKTLGEISKKLGISAVELTKAVESGKLKDLSESQLTKKAESEVKDNG